MVSWGELLKYHDWIPVSKDNEDLVRRQQRIGLMRTSVRFKDGEEPIEIARLTQRGYRFARRDQIAQERGLWAGVRRFLYSYLNSLNGFSLGEDIFVRER